MRKNVTLHSYGKSRLRISKSPITAHVSLLYVKLYTIPESNIARENCLTNGCFGLRGAIERIVHDLV